MASVPAENPGLTKPLLDTLPEIVPVPPRIPPPALVRVVPPRLKVRLLPRLILPLLVKELAPLMDKLPAVRSMVPELTWFAPLLLMVRALDGEDTAIVPWLLSSAVTLRMPQPQPLGLLRVIVPVLVRVPAETVRVVLEPPQQPTSVMMM